MDLRHTVDANDGARRRRLSQANAVRTVRACAAGVCVEKKDTAQTHSTCSDPTGVKALVRGLGGGWWGCRRIYITSGDANYLT